MYLLCLFGSMMSTTSHGSCVSPRLIEHAKNIARGDIDEIKQVSYDSAVLVGLFRANCSSCMRSREKANYVGRPLLSYTHLRIGSPEVIPNDKNNYTVEDNPTVGSYWTTRTVTTYYTSLSKLNCQFNR